MKWNVLITTEIHLSTMPKNNIANEENLNEFSIYHDYASLNNNFKVPEFYQIYIISEPNHILLTKYRTGSHNLQIVNRISVDLENIYVYLS